jgi:glycerol-3-phosphate dehydrogenase
MKLNTKVIEGRWDENDGVWNITLEDQKDKGQLKVWAHVFINGTGTWSRSVPQTIRLIKYRHS